MLRKVLLALTGGLLALALFGTALQWWPLAGGCALGAFWTFVIWAVTFLDRPTYKTILDRVPAGEGWVATAERFVDHKTGRTITVYIKPQTGERTYVAEAGSSLAQEPPHVA